MRLLIVPMLALMLAGCAVLEKAAPLTVAGWHAGGAVGALNGMANGVVAKCLKDGGVFVKIRPVVTTIVSNNAADHFRKVRDAMCGAVGAENVTERAEEWGLL